MAAPKRCTPPAWKLTEDRRSRDDRDREAARERRPDHGRGRVRGPGRATDPRRARRGTVAHARHRHGREHPPRPPAMGAARRRASLRPRPAPAGTGRHQGNRPRAAPVQRRDLHPAAGVEPRLRDPLGQHVAVALRPDRAAGVGGDPGDGDRRRRLDADVHRDRRRRLPAAHVLGRATSRWTRTARPATGAIVEHWRQGWLPGEDVAHLPLQRRPERPAAVPLEGGHRRQDRPLRRSRRRWPPTRRRRCGPRSATASTTGSSTGRRWTGSSPATARSPARRR